MIIKKSPVSSGTVKGNDREEYAVIRRQREWPCAGRPFRRGIAEGSSGTGTPNGQVQ